MTLGCLGYHRSALTLSAPRVVFDRCLQRYYLRSVVSILVLIPS